MSRPWMTPDVARRIRHQSFPGTLLRLDSHPSIHLPRSVYLSAMKIPLPGFKRFSFSAKKSSLQEIVFPPNRSAARSVNLVNSGAVVFILLLGNNYFIF